MSKDKYSDSHLISVYGDSKAIDITTTGSDSTIVLKAGEPVVSPPASSGSSDINILALEDINIYADDDIRLISDGHIKLQTRVDGADPTIKTALFDKDILINAHNDIFLYAESDVQIESFAGVEIRSIGTGSTAVPLSIENTAEYDASLDLFQAWSMDGMSRIQRLKLTSEGVLEVSKDIKADSGKVSCNEFATIAGGAAAGKTLVCTDSEGNTEWQDFDYTKLIDEDIEIRATTGNVMIYSDAQHINLNAEGSIGFTSSTSNVTMMTNGPYGPAYAQLTNEGQFKLTGPAGEPDEGEPGSQYGAWKALCVIDVNSRNRNQRGLDIVLGNPWASYRYQEDWPGSFDDERYEPVPWSGAAHVFQGEAGLNQSGSRIQSKWIRFMSTNPWTDADDEPTLKGMVRPAPFDMVNSAYPTQYVSYDGSSIGDGSTGSSDAYLNSLAYISFSKDNRSGYEGDSVFWTSDGTSHTTGSVETQYMSAQYVSGAEDFGEWFEVGDLSEWGAYGVDENSCESPAIIGLPEGLVVWVHEQKFYRQKTNQNSIPLLITKRALVIGSGMPIISSDSEDKESKDRSSPIGEILSICGKLPIMVFGAAKSGDYLIPDELEGFCRAVDKRDVTFEQYKNAIGRAMSSCDETNMLNDNHPYEPGKETPISTVWAVIGVK